MKFHPVYIAILIIQRTPLGKKSKYVFKTIKKVSLWVFDQYLTKKIGFKLMQNIPKQIDGFDSFSTLNILTLPLTIVIVPI